MSVTSEQDAGLHQIAGDWLKELRKPTPDVAIIASLEHSAETQYSVSLPDLLSADSGGLTAGFWSELFHPREENGKFAKKSEAEKEETRKRTAEKRKKAAEWRDARGYARQVERDKKARERSEKPFKTHHENHKGSGDSFTSTESDKIKKGARQAQSANPNRQSEYTDKQNEMYRDRENTDRQRKENERENANNGVPPNADYKNGVWRDRTTGHIVGYSKTEDSVVNKPHFSKPVRKPSTKPSPNKPPARGTKPSPNKPAKPSTPTKPSHNKPPAKTTKPSYTKTEAAKRRKKPKKP